ncbi:MAG: hypothetical protein QMD95_04980 [Candidatus Hodarchaeaceae archaeon]|nr:hypothetical protein [Candidatus Hodarchaeaceae archaeon]
MGALNYIAAVVFAVLFIGVGFTLYSQYQRGAAEQEFRLRAAALAEQIEALGNQTENTVLYFNIFVPPNCTLSFKDSSVVIRIGEWSDNFQVGVSVSGPTFTEGKLNLKLLRTENGVDVSAA